MAGAQKMRMKKSSASMVQPRNAAKKQCRCELVRRPKYPRRDIGRRIPEPAFADPLHQHEGESARPAEKRLRRSGARAGYAHRLIIKSIVFGCLGYCFGVRPLFRFVLLVLCALPIAASSVHAQHYVERQIRIPWALAGPSGLDALLVYVDLPGKHPLVVLTHGSARSTQDHALVTPWQQLPQALWFARRGWIVLAVVRRGYGSSGGDPDGNHGGRCSNRTAPDYEAAGVYAA